MAERGEAVPHRAAVPGGAHQVRRAQCPGVLGRGGETDRQLAGQVGGGARLTQRVQGGGAGAAEQVGEAFGGRGAGRDRFVVGDVAGGERVGRVDQRVAAAHGGPDRERGQAAPERGGHQLQSVAVQLHDARRAGFAERAVLEPHPRVQGREQAGEALGRQHRQPRVHVAPERRPHLGPLWSDAGEVEVTQAAHHQVQALPVALGQRTHPQRRHRSAGSVGPGLHQIRAQEPARRGQHHRDRLVEVDRHRVEELRAEPLRRDQVQQRSRGVRERRRPPRQRGAWPAL